VGRVLEASGRLLSQLLAPPRRLLFREGQLEEAVELLRRGESFAVRGGLGVGKTTLVRVALSRVAVPHVYVECMACRTYSCIRKKVQPGVLNVLDDYSLSQRTPELVFLASSLPLKVLVVHAGFSGEEIKGLRVIEMPPYTKDEIFEILLERVAELGLRVGDEQVEACAEKGFKAGGNVRVALLCLLGYL
jgi:Cdc6-like AAA superfamily ATPase